MFPMKKPPMGQMPEEMPDESQDIKGELLKELMEYARMAKAQEMRGRTGRPMPDEEAPPSPEDALDGGGEMPPEGEESDMAEVPGAEGDEAMPPEGGDEMPPGPPGMPQGGGPGGLDPMKLRALLASMKAKG